MVDCKLNFKRLWGFSFFLVLLVFCLFVGMKYAQNITLIEAYGGWSPIDWVAHRLMPENFKADFPSGSNSYRISSFMQFYVLLAKVGFDIERLIPWVICFEVLFLGISAALLFRAIAHKSPYVAATIFAVLVVEGSVRNMELARFGGAFYQGLYYNIADGLRLLGLVCLIRGRVVSSAMLLGLGCTVHPIMAGMACLFALPYVAIEFRNYPLYQWLKAVTIFFAITGIWFGLNIGSAEVASGGVPSDVWLALVRMFNYHWFPIDIGVLTTSHNQYILPLLCLLSLSALYLPRVIPERKRSLGVTLGIGLLLITLSAGVLISEFLPVPFLIKLSLHRASDLLILISMIIVVAGLTDDIYNGGIVEAALSTGLLFSPLISNAFPALIVIIFLCIHAVKLQLAGNIKQKNLIIGFMAIILVSLVIFYINKIALTREYVGHLFFWTVVVGAYFTIMIVRWGAGRVVFLSRIKSGFISIALICALIDFSAYRVIQKTKMPEAQTKLSTDYLEAQRWARINTKTDAVFMVDPTIYYGWRDFSQRSSYGNLREWLHTGWLYDSQKLTYQEGMKRFGEFGINWADYLNRRPSIQGFDDLSEDIKSAFYSKDEEWFKRLGGVYKINYIVFIKEHLKYELKLRKVYENGSFIIYSL
jgi:hypothetical protein